MLEHVPLEVVFVYFDTATYDEIQKDEKVSFLAPHPCQSLTQLVGQSFATSVGSRIASFLNSYMFNSQC